MNYDPQQKRGEILALLAEGKSLRTACIETGVHLQTVMGWLRKNDQFRQDYAEAKQEGADAMADRITELAEQAIKEPEKANAIRVAIDSYKWTASKLKPKSYGDRIEQHVVNETQSPGEVADRIKQLETELAELLRAGQRNVDEQPLSTHSTTPAPVSPTIQ